jgi:predicted amidophosphoribosyltransferase
VSLRPPSSRCQLTWKVFDQGADGSWKLVLPRYYAGLFEVSFPSLVKKARAGFRDSSTGKTRIATFSDLDEQGVRRIQGFLEWYGRAVCVSTNEHLESHFADELDFCLALDFTRPSPDQDRTPIGEWEYQAKYHQDEAALAGLAKELCQAARWLPPSRMPQPRLLTYVPSDPDREFYLPAELVEAIRQDMPAAFWGVEDPLVIPTLTVDKESAKDLTVAEKIAQWEEIVQAKGIRLSRSVRGCSVIVVDDLYQSGASLWSYAKYLKGRQAGMVAGLACVKSLRDTDNK